jgi:hypothetical protein
VADELTLPVEGRIISVPHSGTRTLCHHLGHVGDNNKAIEYHYWHFGMNDPDIVRYDGIVHIPLRDPFDIAMSWEARYLREQHKDGPNMLRHFDLMLDYVVGRPQTQFWLIDKLKTHRGKGPEHWCKLKKNRDKAVQLDRSYDLFKWYRTHPTAREFYAKHFPKGFWWE